MTARGPLGPRLLVGMALAACVASMPAQASASPTPGEFEYHYREEWRRFGLWDYIGTAATLGAFYAIEFGLEGPTEAHLGSAWPPFDERVRELTVGRTFDARFRAAKLSDRLWYGIVGFSVVDAAATPLVRGGDWESSIQLSLMNLQAYAAVSLLVRIPHKLIGRERPLAVGCREDPEYAAECGTDGRYVSFFGGHGAVSMTAAGLVCAHHLHGELYGGGAADIVTCTAALATGLTVSHLRLVADKHWASDQIIASAVGLSSGFVLPTLLYYQPHTRRVREHRHSAADGLRWSVVPIVTGNSVSARLVVGG